MDLTPRMIFWETTKRCNLKCAYCRRVLSRTGNELSTSEAFAMMDSLKENFGAPILVLSGGEPLLREDLWQILDHASTIGLSVALATNGVMLGAKEALMLKERGIKRVSLSLDSVDVAFHDKSRGVVGSFEKTKDAAAILRKFDVPFQINFTVTRTNKQEVRSIAQWAVSIGAIAVHYFVLVPVGCGKEVQQEEMLDAFETEAVLKDIKNLVDEFSIEIRPTCAPQYARFTKDQHFRGCLAGTAIIFISAEGDVYPCGYLPTKAGLLRESSIDEIWKHSSVLNTLRKNDIKDGCAVCAFKNQCRGCRARAYGITGDYMAGDSTCVLEKEVVSTLIDR